MDNIQNIRDKFVSLKEQSKYRNGTIEIQNAQFVADDYRIFGEPNPSYVEAELQWYKLMSLNVNDLFKIYGKEVKIWKDIADPKGYINSNYGWCVFSSENGSQFRNVRKTLLNDPNSRQAVMIYTRPHMHSAAILKGRRDFMCTTHVQYFINDGQLDTSVYMRSNDAVFGFLNDLAWQRYVTYKLAMDLQVVPGEIIWNAGSLHVYERHYGLVS